MRNAPAQPGLERRTSTPGEGALRAFRLVWSSARRDIPRADESRAGGSYSRHLFSGGPSFDPDDAAAGSGPLSHRALPLGSGPAAERAGW